MPLRHVSCRMDVQWYRQLGSRIGRLRAKAGLTQEVLAERSGIGASYLARIEVGSRRPTLDVLGAIAAALDVPLHRLVADERAVRAAEGWEAWGRSGRALTALLLELDDTDAELLLKIATRMRR
jgi:transcriptional regulator with XRE-family HTH domain